MERAQYIQDRKGRYIPTHLLTNRRDLATYLKGYKAVSASDVPKEYTGRRKNLFAYGHAVKCENSSLYTRDGTIFHPRKLRPIEKMISEKYSDEFEETKPLRDLEHSDTLDIMKAMTQNPHFIPAFAFPGFSERDL